MENNMKKLILTTAILGATLLTGCANMQQSQQSNGQLAQATPQLNQYL